MSFFRMLGLFLLVALPATSLAGLPAKHIVRVISFGHFGRGIAEFHYPVGIALSPAGGLWITDWKNNRVSRHDIFGKYLAPLNPKGTAFNGPVGVAIDSQGNIVVAEHRRHWVRKYNPAGDEVWRIGTRYHGSGQNQFKSPRGVAINSKDHIFVADTGNGRIQEFTPKGSFVKSYVFLHPKNETRTKPRGVAVDYEDRVWGVYSSANLIARFNRDGNAIFHFGGAGQSRGEFENPRYCCFDVRNNLYVSDFKNHRIQKFSPKGEFMYVYGSKGNSRGQFENPEGVAVDKAGNIYVVDKGNYRIQYLQVNELIRDKNLGFYYTRVAPDPLKAIEAYEKALKSDPACLEAIRALEKLYQVLGQEAHFKGQYYKAEKYFKRIVAYHPSNPLVQKRLRAIMWHTNKGRVGYIALALGIVAAMAFLIHLMVKVLKSG